MGYIMSTEIEFTTDHKFTMEAPKAPEVETPMFEFLHGIYRPNEIYNFAYSQWHDLFNAQKVSSVVETLENGGDFRDPLMRSKCESELLWIKELRRKGNRLVDVWKLLENEHKAPKSLKKVVSCIGKYKDSVLFLGKEERHPEELLERVDKLTEKGHPSFVPSSFLSFYETYSGYLTEMQSILNMRELTLEKHHTLRKRARTLRHYFYLVDQVTGNSQAKSFADFLEPVSVEMGKVQDQVFVLERTGKADVEKDTTKLKDKHRSILENFINLHSSY